MKRDTKINSLVEEAQRELFGWVPFDFWAKIAPTETREKVRTRIKEGKWLIGIHAHRPSQKELWIHLRNAKAWIEGETPEVDAPRRAEWSPPEAVSKPFKVLDRPID